MKSVLYAALLLAASPVAFAGENTASTLALSTIVFVDLAFLICLFLVVVTLRRDPAWSLAHALAETITWPDPKAAVSQVLGAAGLQGAAAPAGKAPATTEPRLESSASRLIAFIGMLAVVVVFMGMANCVLWQCFAKHSAEQAASKAGDTTSGQTWEMIKFLFAGSSLFVPYAVNQFRSAFESFGHPEKK